jgi:succinoglycan biosynthesis protein ExoA
MEESQESREFISIVIPALNEESYIERALNSLVPKDNDFDYEIIVMDGGSTDTTIDIVSELNKADSRIKLFHNEKRIQSSGVNIGARLTDARASIFVRADCHASYPKDFVKICVTALRDSGAASVVVPMEAQGLNCFQRAVAAAQNSRLGNGGSAHRLGGQSGFVDHGHHAAFDRAAFLAVGGYDESLVTNEDYDLDFRLNKSGRRVWLETAAKVIYYPRDTSRTLFRQYRRHGAGRSETRLKHKYPLKLRQLLPVVTLFAVLFSLIFSALFSILFLIVPLVYFGISLAWGAVLAVRQKDRCLLGMGYASVIMHFAWAIGFTEIYLGSLLTGDRPRGAGGSSDTGQR